MSDYRNSFITKILNTANVVLIALPFALSWLLYYTERMAVVYYYKGNSLIIFIFGVLYICFCQIYEGFTAYMLRKFEVVYSQGLAAFVADFLMYIICWLLSKDLPAVWPLMLVFAAQLCLSVVWVCIAHYVYAKRFSPPDTALVYGSRKKPGKLRKKYRIDENFHITVTVGIDECMLNNFAQLKDVKAVFICGVYGYERDALLQHCMLNRLTAYMLPGVGDIMVKSTRPMHMAHVQLFRLDSNGPSVEYLAVKRVFDVVASIVALIILSPVLLVTAIAIKACDGGPVLYKQCRLTKDGKTFEIIKFRSMRVDAENDGVARLSSGAADDRITPVGRVIRKVRIDEIPQFFNIVKGDMSLVGPRPERPEIAAQYEQELPEFGMRKLMKAGLTGYAQVYGQYNTAPFEKLQMDLMYIANCGIVEDLRIIFATVKILFIPESTEGVTAGKCTASEKAEQESDLVSVGASVSGDTVAVK